MSKDNHTDGLINTKLSRTVMNSVSSGTNTTMLGTLDSLEVAWCADVCLGQLLLLPLALFLPLGEGGVHNVVHLRVVMVTLNTVDLWVFNVDCGHE